MTPPETVQTTAPVPGVQWPQENSDAAVEAEVARLLGGAPLGDGARTATEVMDAISAANNQKSDLRKFLAIYEAVSQLGKGALLEAFERAINENNPTAIRALERRWAEIDPAGAAKALAEKKISSLSEAFCEAWAKSDPAGALQWFAGLENGDQKNLARTSILNRIATVDPSRALDYANQMPAGEDQKQLLSRALAAIGKKDPGAAFAAAQTLPEGDIRKTGLDAVLTQIASTNVSEAQRLLSELPPNSVSSAPAVITSRLARDNPQNALDFAATLAEGAGRDAASGALAREWAGRDVEAAAKWLDSIPKGATRDSAVASFATRTAPRDPEGATLWASTLPPGKQRSATLTQTISIWQRTNPAAAAEWINAAPELSPDERKALSQVQPGRPDFQRLEQFRRQRVGN
ncbi:MAG: hypothetical protein EBS01_00570 [Verrucomicrobia bacterium]|nr:hypothetical protein [Verrucomicrobiota bacterium]